MKPSSNMLKANKKKRILNKSDKGQKEMFVGKLDNQKRDKDP